MGVAVPRAPVVTRSPEPPQKFGHGPKFVGQLLSRNQVSQNKSGDPSCPQEKVTGALLISIEGNWCSTDIKRRKLVLYYFARERNWCTSVLKEKETGALLLSGEGNWCSTVFRRKDLMLYCSQEMETDAALFLEERNRTLSCYGRLILE